jgi:hypothetical protein
MDYIDWLFLCSLALNFGVMLNWLCHKAAEYAEDRRRGSSMATKWLVDDDDYRPLP